MHILKQVTLPALLSALPAVLAAQVVPLHTLNSSQLGVEVQSYKYEEQYNGAFVMSNEGNKVGLAAGFTQPLDDNWFWGADIRQAHGNVSYASASTGSKGSNPDIITEIRIIGGKDHAAGSQVLAPYFGLGYRNLFNDLRGYTTTGNRGYRRVSHYTYLPLGVTHRMRVGAQARFSTTLEYDLLLEGRQQSFMSDVNVSYNDPVNIQREGNGLKLMATYETWHWSFGAYAHFWRLADSDLALRTQNGLPNAVIMEPSNTTRETGVVFKLNFH